MLEEPKSCIRIKVVYYLMSLSKNLILSLALCSASSIGRRGMIVTAKLSADDRFLFGKFVNNRSSAASCFCNGFRLEVVVTKDFNDLIGFPRRILGMPSGVVFNYSPLV